MEKLIYTIEDKTITELLGVQNFSTKESAVLELVKNAYDAKARNITLDFYQIDKKLVLEITDVGEGLSERDIREKWMHVGRSDKDYSFKDDDGNTRISAGSKGIGRFAIARLGGQVVLESKKLNEKAVLWVSDGNTNHYSESSSQMKRGTKIVIKELRDRWNKAEVVKLVDFLSRTYNDTIMNIEVIFEGEKYLVRDVFSNLKMGVHYTNEIELKYDSKNGILCGKVLSEEFKDSVIVRDIDIKSYSFELDLQKKEKRNQKLSDEDILHNNVIMKIGDFASTIYFTVGGVSSEDFEKFKYKHKIALRNMSSGIILYRNAFSISSYDGKKDWLDLNARSRKSPAAASHPTGSWRVRANQVFGSVVIDKIENANLKDLSNRQGLEENDYYESFVEIIQLGIAEFERYRQKIIRSVVSKLPRKVVKSKTPLIDTLISNPSAILKFTDDQTISLVKEIKKIEKESKTFEKLKNESEDRFKYDVRILNVLATIGLKSSSIAHELHNMRNNLDTFHENIVEALEKHKMWDELNSPQCKEFSVYDVPKLLEDNVSASKKVLTFTDAILEEIEKEAFVSKKTSIHAVLESIKKKWEYDYSWVKILVEPLGGEDDQKLMKDTLVVVFDNLILNSIQQNDREENLNIEISYSTTNDYIHFSYKDDGVGLNEKYRDDPYKILEVHETTRNKGHGLGMWIMNNTLSITNGLVDEIISDNGFKINFRMGIESNEK